MFTVASLAAGQESGYMALPFESVFGSTWDVRRYDNGSFSTIDTGPGGFAGGDLALMRRDGDYVETYKSIDGGDNWLLRTRTLDTTYIGPFFFVLGVTGVETSWGDLGGGLRNRAHIYRILKAEAGVRLPA